MTNAKLRPLLASILLPCLLPFATGGCGSPTATGNPAVTLAFAPYGSSALFELIPSAYAAVSSATLCFKRLRFKTQDETTSADPANDSDNIDFSLGEVTLSPSGTTLSSVQIPAGTYTRIEFDLEDKCASGKSLQLTNSNGSFSTDQRITIKFNGTFTATGATQNLSLAIDSILTALDAATNNNGLKSTAEGASGTF
jgi:Domain of unknown function (DUF4382)